MRLLALIFLCLTLSARAAVQQYFIDPAGGDDTHAGTSTSTAWKTIPGTRNAADNAYQSATYGGGTISTSSKVQPNTTFIVKGGTKQTSATGGFILMDTTYYANTANQGSPIVITNDQTWQTGPTTFDAAGVTFAGGGGFGFFHVKVNGVNICGDHGTNGFQIFNSTYDGVSAFPGSDIEGPNISSCLFSNCGTAYNSGANNNASAASIQLHACHSNFVHDVWINGGGNWFQGIHVGDNEQNLYGVVISNCVVWNHTGDDAFGGDSGICYKCQGSNVLFIACEGFGSFKGFDLGTKNSSQWNVTYKVINCYAHDCTNGINCNGPPNSYHPYTGAVNMYLINNIIRNCWEAGSQIYHSPLNIHVVHNVYDNCGGSGYARAALMITPDNSESDHPDDQTLNAHVYNNCIYKPASTYAAFTTDNFNHTTNVFNLDMDYNSWVQRASEDAMWWNPLNNSWYNALDNQTFSFGANGPGHASGNWYAWYSYDTTPPVKGGTAHFHADAHSKGTGATDTTSPPFNNEPGADYTLTAAYHGTDISGQAWYTSEMGKDRAGTTRVKWDMGAYENSAADPNITVQPANITVSVGQTITETVTANSPNGYTLSYQWVWFSTNVTGATSSAWTTPALTLAENGSTASVNVTDTAGTLASTACTIGVLTSATPFNMTFGIGSGAAVGKMTFGVGTGAAVGTMTMSK